MDDEIFDRLVAGVYRAAAGKQQWAAALSDIADAFDAWAVQLMGWDKHSGRLTFSHYGGSASPATSLGYIVSYHDKDPRVALAMSLECGQWLHCDDHFDDAFVATSPFYQEFLLPQGGRYVSGTKIYETPDAVAIFSSMRGVGSPPHDAGERAALARLAHHVRDAFAMYRHLRAAFEEAGAGRELLDRFAYPMIIMDELGGIRFRNAAASAAIAEGDYVVDRAGVLACSDPESHADFMAAVQNMGLQGDAHAAPGPMARRYVRIRRRSTGAPIVVNLVALRPEATMRAFGNAAVALVLLHDPAVARELDPFLVAEIFDLTPAEARVAVALHRGEAPRAIAERLRVSDATVRSQIMAVHAKTRVTRQADLARLLSELAGQRAFRE